jgi:hypothetical protein
MSRSYEKKYFTYQGKYYGYGTVVKLKPEAYAGLVRIENCGGIMEFHKGYTNGNYQFRIVTDDIYQKSSIFLKDPLENSIGSIVKPVEVVPQSAWQNALENFSKTPQGTRPDVKQGTIIYIAVLLLTAIFKDRVGLWILETIVYVIYLINAYRD